MPPYLSPWRQRLLFAVVASAVAAMIAAATWTANTSTGRGGERAPNSSAFGMPMTPGGSSGPGAASVTAAATEGPVTTPAPALPKFVPGLPPFLRSLDTMKESRDLQSGNQLTDEQIKHSVDLAVSLNVDYVVVATDWEFPDYLERWVRAVRAAGKRVWFRGEAERWRPIPGRPVMTPEEYIHELKAFITSRPHLFEEGDIFDPGPEPENGAYWAHRWGGDWSWQPAYPNDATRAFNVFVRESQLVARLLFADLGKPGVITSVRSINGWWATHPNALEHETVALLGAITIDSYPDGRTADPNVAAQLRVSELMQIWAVWGVPVLIGELGYPLHANVTDEQQRAALAESLRRISGLPFVVGLNYWIGAPNVTANDSTALFRGDYGNWRLRPAARELATFFQRMPAIAASRPPISLPEWRYGPEEIKNGGFERDESWGLDEGFERRLSLGIDGGWGLRVPGRGKWANAYQDLNLAENTCYVAFVHGRGAGTARIDVVDREWRSLAAAPIPPSTDWQRATLSFNSRSQTKAVLVIRDTDSKGYLDLDNVSLRRCPGPVAAANN